MQDFAGNSREETCLAAFGFRAGVGIDGAEDSIESPIGPGRDGKLKPAADQKVRRTGSFCEKDGILITHRDDG
ncbi:hypothetical protein D3C87_2082800 [compost metagenome]